MDHKSGSKMSIKCTGELRFYSLLISDQSCVVIITDNFMMQFTVCVFGSL